MDHATTCPVFPRQAVLYLQAPRQNKAKAPRGAAVSDDSVALAVIADPAQGFSAGFLLAVLVDEVKGVDDLAVQVAIAEAADDDLLALAELALSNRVSDVLDLTAWLISCGLGALFDA